jgi:hypothetical protein
MTGSYVAAGRSSAGRSSLLAIGVRVTVRHYYDFGADRAVVGADLAAPESWDRLRARTDGAFSIPATREAFLEAAADHDGIAQRARAIDAWLSERRVRSVASYGVGAAMLEWWLRRLRPQRALVCTDFGAATVATLNELVPELDARLHDLRRDGPLPAEVHLFHRIDTELSDQEWREVLRRFESASILLVAAQVLDARALLRELLDRPRMWALRATRAGFLRSRSAFESIWQPTHRATPLRMHDLDAWFLTPR